MVTAGETGWLVPPGDSAALARAITAVAGDMGHAQAMAKRAREVSRPRFDSVTHVRAIERVYKSVLGPPLSSGIED